MCSSAEEQGLSRGDMATGSACPLGQGSCQQLLRAWVALGGPGADLTSNLGAFVVRRPSGCRDTALRLRPGLNVVPPGSGQGWVRLLGRTGCIYMGGGEGQTTRNASLGV